MIQTRLDKVRRTLEETIVMCNNQIVVLETNPYVDDEYEEYLNQKIDRIKCVKQDAEESLKLLEVF